MAIIKAVSSRASIGKAISYVTKTEKTEERLVSGIGCNPETAVDEMKTTKELWGKTAGRQYKHIVQSFPPGEKITPEQAHEIARQLCTDRFSGYEVLIATHKDREHIHNHIILNSVSYEDGLKFQQSRADLQAVKDKSDELCKEYGLSIAGKNDEITANTNGKYRALERGISGNYKSFVVDCYRAAVTARQSAVNRQDFINLMKAAGWETTWTESRKHITFADENGNRVRAANLEKTFKEPFGKDDLEHGFESNLERANGRATADPRGTAAEGSRSGNTDAAIAELEAAIGKSKAAVSADDRQRADRIADEQSRRRERDRASQQRIAEKSRRSKGYER